MKMVLTALSDALIAGRSFIVMLSGNVTLHPVYNGEAAIL
jgi:hypothetical protein